MVDLTNMDPEQLAQQLYDEPLSGSLPTFTSKDEFRLDDTDRTSATWLRIESFLTARLSQIREANDNPLSPLETAEIRGKIGAIKEFLAIGKPLAMNDPDSPDLGY